MASEKPRKYLLETEWGPGFRDLGVSEQDMLRRAELPLDLFHQKSPALTAQEVYRLCHAIDDMNADDPTYMLRHMQAITLDSFSPPVFACLCSQDLTTAARRLTKYKPIIGPFELQLHELTDNTAIEIREGAGHEPLPRMMILFELLFWVKVARAATREHIVPVAAEVTIDLPAVEHYEAYLGVSIQRGDTNRIVFSAQDARKPFLSPNPAMWSIFEPELQKRMADVSKGDQYRTRVRACLNEMLASGQSSIDVVAAKLSLSSRTLQRRLRQEGTSFHEIRDELREELAHQYLTRTDYSSQQIAFLLGYEETSSFYRAVRSWTGRTPEMIRTAMR